MQLSTGKMIAVAASFAASVVWLGVAPAHAGWAEDMRRLMTPEFMARVWQSEEPITLGEVVGRPPAVPVYNAAGENIGYILSTLQSGRYSGYSGTPFDIVAGVTNEGQVMGIAALVEHYEPIIDKGVPLAHLIRYLDQLNTVHTWNRFKTELEPNVVQGATITATLMRDGLINSARKVLRTRDAPPYTGPAVLDMEGFEAFSWDELEEIGAMERLSLTNRNVAEAFLNNGYGDAKLADALGPPDELFLELLISLGTPPAIGQNIAAREYERYIADTGGQFLLIAGTGVYDYKGTNYRHAAYGKLFDRIRILQDGEVIHLSGENFLHRTEFRAEGVEEAPQPGFVRRRAEPGAALDDFGSAEPEAGGGFKRDPAFAYRRSGVFGISDPAFDPVRPFTVQLLVGAIADGGPVMLPFAIEYQVPEEFILRPEEDSIAAAQQDGNGSLPLWMQVWVDQRGDIAVLAAAMVVLSLLVWKQDIYTRHRHLYRVVRLSFLAFTFGWLGWYANAQLSVINLLVYFQAPFADLEWTFYMTEPLIVMVAAYTLVSLIIFGRSLFCGWLCPFGALQEILSRLAGFFRIPQIRLSLDTHRRLWWIKYVIWGALIPIAFLSRELMVTTVEVEPFKTAITAHFQREWPFVAYAVGLLIFGMVMERAYCRFVCPLGAGLALLGRFNVVRFLRRRPECGTPAGVEKGGCHLCEHTCAYSAIGPDGQIIEEECFYCLDCQAEYHDAYRCPPLSQVRKRGERLTGFGSGQGVATA